jgi:YVTN family beta-propeller protein
MDSATDWLISLVIPFGTVFILKEITTPYALRFLFANKEKISAAAGQGKEVAVAAYEHGPTIWQKVKRYFKEVKGGIAYIVCTSQDPNEPDFIQVVATAPISPMDDAKDNDNANKPMEIEELIDCIPIGKSPAGIAMSPDKSRIYVISRVERALYVIDSKKNKVIEIIGDLRENPEEIAITPDGKKICIIHRDPDPTRNSQMTILHLEKKQVKITRKQSWWKHKLTMKNFKGHKQDWVEVGKDARAIVIIEKKDGKQNLRIALIANYGDQNITYVDIDHPTVTNIIPVQDHPHHIVANQQYKLVYVLSARSIKCIDPFSLESEPVSILAGEIKRPERAVFDQKGRLYVTDSGDDCIKIIDRIEGLLARIKVGKKPQGIAVAATLRTCDDSNDEYIWICCANAGSNDAHWIHLFFVGNEDETSPLLKGFLKKKQPEDASISLRIWPIQKGYWKELIETVLNQRGENAISNQPVNLDADHPGQQTIFHQSTENAIPNQPVNLDADHPEQQAEMVSNGECVFIMKPNRSKVIYSDPSRIGKAEQSFIPLKGTALSSKVQAIPGRAVVTSSDANKTERWCNLISAFMVLVYLITSIQLFIEKPNEIYTLVSEQVRSLLEMGRIGIPVLFVIMSILSIIAIPKMRKKVKLVFVIVAVLLFVIIMAAWLLSWAFAVKPATGYNAYISDFGGNVLLGMDTETNRTTARIGVGRGPDSLAVFPGATEICVANWRNGTVSIVDTQSNSVTATISVGNGPRNATISPDGGECWVSNQFDQSVSVVDMATKQVVAIIEVEGEPGAMSFTVDGTEACVVNVGSGTVSIIDTKIYNATKSIDVGQLPEGIVTDHLSNVQWTYVTSRRNHSVAVINVKGNVRRTIIPVGGDPRGVALVPEKKKLYVSIFNAGIVSVINTANDSIIANIAVETQPHTLLLSPNHSRLYVTNELSSSISVIDTETDNVIATISIGLFNDELWSIAITPDGNQIVVTYYDSGWISIVNTASPYAVRTIRMGVQLRQVVFVEK